MSAYTQINNLEVKPGAYDPDAEEPSDEPENKYRDGAGTNTLNVPTSGLRVIDSMVSSLATGAAGAGGRIGNEIRVNRIMFRVTNYTTVLNSFDAIRWIICIDHQCDGAVPAYGNVLSSPNIRAFRNLENARRFTILYDTTESASPVFLASSYSDYYYWDTQVDLEVDIPIKYSGDTGTISQIKSNNICVFACSRVGVVNFQDCVYRIRYTDTY